MKIKINLLLFEVGYLLSCSEGNYVLPFSLWTTKVTFPNALIKNMFALVVSLLTFSLHASSSEVHWFHLKYSKFEMYILFY